MTLEKARSLGRLDVTTNGNHRWIIVHDQTGVEAAIVSVEVSIGVRIHFLPGTDPTGPNGLPTVVAVGLADALINATGFLGHGADGDTKLPADPFAELADQRFAWSKDYPTALEVETAAIDLIYPKEGP